jgi:hypothetical protein
MNIGQILIRSILSTHSPGLKTRTGHSAGNCAAALTLWPLSAPGYDTASESVGRRVTLFMDLHIAATE